MVGSQFGDQPLAAHAGPADNPACPSTHIGEGHSAIPTPKVLHRKSLDTRLFILDGANRNITVAMLCDVCSQMSQAVLGRRPPLEDQRSLVSVLNSAAAGCYICEFAIQHLQSQKIDQRHIRHFEVRAHRFSPGAMRMSLNFRSWENRAGWIDFWAIPTTGFATAEAELIRKRQGHIPEAQAVTKIRQWMGLCLRDHEGTRCRKNDTQPSSYPSRLLDLGPSSFRIVRTVVERPCGPYATLSYCWGPNPDFLRLTSGNETELEAGVSISRLPLAFREAISIIKALSFRYVWIDSLCILQSGPGSAEEWETESARMHEIYADSTLTLALACIASPSQSILNQASTPRTPAPPFVIGTDSGHQDPVAGALTVIPADYFSHSLYELPLGYRAWTLQERFMATRVVSFGLGELFWDCAQLPHASESIPRGFEATQIPNHEFFKLAMKSIPDVPDDESDEESDNWALMETWWNVLNEYRKRSLSYPKKDRLMALSAIAREFGKAMDDVYIAGHFWKTLPASLQWVVEHQPTTSISHYGGRAWRLFWSERPDPRYVERCTPSWSWASLDGPVPFWRGAGPSSQQLAEAVSYTLELANQANPTGPCTSASISIMAYCTEIEWQSRNKPALVACTEAWVSENIKLELDLDEPEVTRVKGTKSLLVAITGRESARDWTGLIVDGIFHEGEKKYRRLGHFAIHDAAVTMESSIWWQERFSIFGGEKRLVELV